MMFPGGRKLAAIAVPFALAAGALTVTALPAHAIVACTPNQLLIQQAQGMETLGDHYTWAEEDEVDAGNYAEANYFYVEAGEAYAEADRLYALACA
jgi:hypothetical protein